jgi:Helix-turn-helix
MTAMLDTETGLLRTMSCMNDIPHPMLEALARVCRQRRRLHEHSQADVAERAGVSRSVINEFEAARTWPRDPDRLVNGYADDADDAAAQLWITAATSLAEGSQT